MHTKYYCKVRKWTPGTGAKDPVLVLGFPRSAWKMLEDDGTKLIGREVRVEVTL